MKEEEKINGKRYEKDGKILTVPWNEKPWRGGYVMRYPNHLEWKAFSMLSINWSKEYKTIIEHNAIYKIILKLDSHITIGIWHIDQVAVV